MFTAIKTYFTDLWAKVKADVTNAISLICTIVGGIVHNIDKIATMLDPNLGQQIATLTGDVRWVAGWALTVGIAGMLANFKNLIQTPKS